MATLIGPLPMTDGTSERTGRRTVRDHYLAIADAATDGPEFWEQISGAPVFGTQHPTVGGLYVSRVNPRKRSGFLKVWDVEVEYDNDFGNGQEPNELSPDQDPINLEASYGWDWEVIEGPYPKSRLINSTTLEPVADELFPELLKAEEFPQNSAGDQFDPPPTDTFARWFFELERFEYATSSVVPYVLFHESTNLSPVTIDGEGEFTRNTLRCRVKVGRKRLRITTGGQILYRSVKYRIDYKPGGWDGQFADMGYREWDGTNKTHIYVNGDPVTDPWPLDGEGAALADTADPAQNTPAVRRYRWRLEQDFAGLLLP